MPLHAGYTLVVEGRGEGGGYKEYKLLRFPKCFLIHESGLVFAGTNRFHALPFILRFVLTREKKRFGPRY